MLTAIGGYTAFALEHAPDGSPLRSDLDEIRKATDRAALLTRQLLAFSRKQVLKPEILDLNEIVVELRDDAAADDRRGHRHDHDASTPRSVRSRPTRASSTRS